MTEDAFTPAQREAVEKAWDLLTEHFDRVLLIVDYETRDAHGNCDAHEGFWHGGSLAALGMCEYARDRILNTGRKLRENPPSEPDGDDSG